MENRRGTGGHATDVLSPLRPDGPHREQGDLEQNDFKQAKDNHHSQVCDCFQSGLEIDIGFTRHAQHNVENGQDQKCFDFHVLAPRQEIQEDRQARPAEN
jgi:hypothetical protein